MERVKFHDPVSVASARCPRPCSLSAVVLTSAMPLNGQQFVLQIDLLVSVSFASAQILALPRRSL